MKSRRPNVVAFLLICACAAPLRGQESRVTMVRAMRDELQRSMERLSLETLKKPFYIAYTVRDLRTTTISASLGALVVSTETRSRPVDVRVIVGDYSRSSENFADFGYGFDRNTLVRETNSMTLEDDYDAIRRMLWIETDEMYKSAAEKYERKIAALKQQKLSPDEAALADFSRAPATAYAAPPRRFTVDRAKWESVVRDLSRRFRNRPELQHSSVDLQIIQGDAYFINSEGTETVQPFTCAAIKAAASTQAPDGEPLADDVRHVGLAPEDLPNPEMIGREIDAMLEGLAALRASPVMSGSYTGPVLIEGEAAGELVAQRFFSGSQSLVDQCKPVLSDPRASMYMEQGRANTLEEKIGTRILPKFLSIHAAPGLKTCDGKILVGSYDIDCDGIKPPGELTLVEKGILKTLLADRIPTPKVDASNGHSRPDISPYAAEASVGPGVILVEGTMGMTASALKKELLQRAKEDGLPYAMIIRSFATPGSEGMDADLLMSRLYSGARKEAEGRLTKPVRMYRVDVSSGKEEPVRSAELGGISLSALRHIVAADRSRRIYNTLVPRADDAGFRSVVLYSPIGLQAGIPATFIHPGGLLFEELEVRAEQRDYTARLPVVPSPLAR